MGTLVTRKNFSYMIYTGVSFINEPLPTNDFLDDILLRIDGPPEYKILDFFQNQWTTCSFLMALAT